MALRICVALLVFDNFNFYFSTLMASINHPVMEPADCTRFDRLFQILGFLRV